MLENINFVNMYFALCLIIWALDVVAVALAIVIPPFRRLLMKLWVKICFNLGCEWAAVALIEFFGEKDANELLDKLKQKVEKTNDSKESEK